METHHLKLNRFNIGSKPDLHAAIGQLYLDLAQVVDQLAHRRLGKVNTVKPDRLLDGLPSGADTEQIEAEAVAELGGDMADVWIEGGDIVFAQRDDSPAIAVAQGGPKLCKKGRFASLVGRIESDNFFKLVDDEQLGGRLAETPGRAA